MGSTTTSPSLLSRVRDPRNQAAWRQFDTRYGELIVRYCRSRRIQYADAEDIRQMVMARLARALRDFRYQPDRGRFRSYLGRITRNEINRYFTRPEIASRRVSAGGEAMDLAVSDREVEAIWEREWIHHHLRLAMQTLRDTFEPRSLEVFERLLGGDPVKQVAADLGMSTGAVHKIKQRVRHRLKKLVSAQDLEDDPDGQTAN